MRWIDTDKWREIFDSIKRHKLRTFLTALSVWWGIFMLVILLGAGNGLQNSVEHNFRDDAVNSLWIYRGTTSKSYKGLPPGRRIQFYGEDYDLLKSEVKGVEHITGRYYLTGEYFVSRGFKSLSFDVRSVHPDHKELENTIMTEGRFINESDLRNFRKVCVIGNLVVDGFFPDEDPIGKYLNIRGVEFQVVGTFTDTGNDNERRKIYIPITTAQKVYEGEDRIHQLMITVGNASTAESQKIEQDIRRQMAIRHNFDPGDEQAIYVSNTVENFQEMQLVFTFIKGFIWFVGIGSIIAGVIGVSNIMLIIVKDRTKEIGIRKAMGATPRAIVTMIVQEAIFITGVAGYVGLLSGFIIIYGLNAFLVQNEVETEFFRNPEVDFVTVLIAVIVLVISGALAGLLPAIQAVRINPVSAMRT